MVWGKFAKEIGLKARIEAVDMGQKNHEHPPQAKVLELFVPILTGEKYLQDISLAAFSLDKDLTGVQAWGQSSWADYSGVSRTMGKRSWEEDQALGCCSHFG